MSQPTDIDLLLIGKTGNGKSATGNSILGKSCFPHRASVSSVTTQIDHDVCEFNGQIIKVVDGPGVGDTRLNTEGAVQRIMSTMQHAIAANPRGYHAFLLVVRFGGRFTEEDQDTIEFLKKVFGQNFVRNYCVLVVTCGDLFDREAEETGQSFPNWCSEQSGVFSQLLRECGNRVILFDNVTKDANKRHNKVGKLLNIVNNLRFRGVRYTDENFNRCKDARHRLLIEAKSPMIQEETLNETSLIIQKLQEIHAKKDLATKIVPLEELRGRAERLYQNIESQDQRTGALQGLINTVKALRDTLNEEVGFCRRMIQEIENIKQQEEHKRKQLDETARQEMEAFSRKRQEEVNKAEKQYQEAKRRYEEAMENDDSFDFFKLALVTVASFL